MSDYKPTQAPTVDPWIKLNELAERLVALSDKIDDAANDEDRLDHVEIFGDDFRCVYCLERVDMPERGPATHMIECMFAFAEKHERCVPPFEDPEE
jgi:hypothetical protein